MSPVVDLPALPRRLAAADPGWSETTDVLVVGSGVAGLTAALHLREQGLHVTVVTKVNIDDGSTRSTPRPPTPTTPRSPASGCATRRLCACSSKRGRPAYES